jgi:tRNA(Ile)-lysidine synthase
MAIFRIKGDLRHIEYHHIFDLASLIETGSTGKAVNLPQGIIARIEYEKLRIFFPEKINKGGYSLRINVPGETIAPERGFKVVTRFLEQSEIKRFVPNKKLKLFDFDKIENDLFIRTRKSGDIFNPDGMDGKKRLKKFFSDDKISLLERDTIPLLVTNEKILWIVGSRESSLCKVDENTVRGLSVEFDEKNIK